MAAVLLVIAATYLLFVAGSVVLCRVLQKNKGYYYKTNHFISVSQMSYRMRKNGAGLASICILSTMVLVTLSTTICLYTGEEQILRQRYPRDMVTMTYGLPEEDIPAFRESVGALAEKHGASPENVLAYSYAELSGAVIGNRLDMARGNSDDVSLDLRSVYVVPIADYNALYGTDIQLADGEATAYFKGKGFGGDRDPARRLGKLPHNAAARRIHDNRHGLRDYLRHDIPFREGLVRPREPERLSEPPHRRVRRNALEYCVLLLLQP